MNTLIQIMIVAMFVMMVITLYASWETYQMYSKSGISEYITLLQDNSKNIVKAVKVMDAVAIKINSVLNKLKI